MPPKAGNGNRCALNVAPKRSETEKSTGASRDEISHGARDYMLQPRVARSSDFSTETEFIFCVKFSHYNFFCS